MIIIADTFEYNFYLILKKMESILLEVIYCHSQSIAGEFKAYN
jgi:hypothetical protein